MPPFPTPAGYDSAVFEATTTIGPIRKRLLRRDAPGPTVILMHEAPGISGSTLDIAARLHDMDYVVVLPELTERPGGPAALQPAIGILRLCMAREMAALTTGRTGAIVEWIRALASAEATRAGRPVAVIGMCFSGGFALGAVVELTVAAAVISQPAIPFAFGRRRARDLAVSDDDLATIVRDRGAGACLRVMRYSKDDKSPRSRFERLQAVFPAAEACEVATVRSSDHSVLRDAARATDGPLVEVFDATAAFLARFLKPAP